MLQEWIPLENGCGGEMRIILQDTKHESEANKVFGSRTNDHRILDAAISLQKNEPKSIVTLVSKDINLRTKG